MTVLIIAEAGVNHNGSYEMALQLVDAAVAAGADIVKFQTCRPELVVSRYAEKAEYQKNTTGHKESQLEMIRNLQLTYTEHKKISQYCAEKGIAYLSTPFDIPSVDEVLSLNVPLLKIPSGEITHYQLLEKIASCNKDVILSTGMSNLNEIKAAINVLQPVVQAGNTITVLHCNTEYPTPYRDVNLRVIPELQKELHCIIGYSDHTQGIEVAIAAVAMGAAVIEKHFTLDRNLEGPDHQASLEPEELKSMVRSIRNIEASLGIGEKKVTESEKKNIHIARKYLVAARPISKGEILTDDNVIAKRVGKEGVNPMCWPRIRGVVSHRSYGIDEPIELEPKAGI